MQVECSVFEDKRRCRVETGEYSSNPTRASFTRQAFRPVTEGEAGTFLSVGELPNTLRWGLKSSESSKSGPKGGESTVAEEQGRDGSRAEPEEEAFSLREWIEGRAVTREIPLSLPLGPIPTGFPMGSSNRRDLGVTLGDGSVERLGEERTERT